MIGSVPWRSGGGAAVAEAGEAALAALRPLAAPAAAAPPTVARTEDAWAVADARLIGRRRLAAEIGPGFLPADREPTDAELVLGAYRRWGRDCPDRLLGEFAFSVWDGRRRSLLCARDPIGARPLCYAHSPSLFAFGSSPLQVLATGAFAGGLDGVTLVDFLSGHFADHARTFFAGVRNVRPGHRIELSGGALAGRRFWHPDRSRWSEHTLDSQGWTEQFRDLLFTVVEDHLDDGGPAVALMTSGGVDSSSIAAVAQDLYRRGRTTTRPVAFVEGFDRFTRSDEWRYASVLVEETGIEHERLVVDELSDLLPAWSDAGPADGPVTVGGALTETVLAAARARGCRTLTTGYGGDTLFDGARFQAYDHVRRGRIDLAWPWIRGLRRRGAGWPRAVAAVLVPPLLSEGGRRALDRLRGVDRYFHAPGWLAPAHRNLAADRLARPAHPRRFSGYARQRQYEIQVGLGQQGPGIESWSTHCARYGVEARFPLLDRRFAEIVLAAPLAIQARPGPGGTKWLLRQATAGVVPDPIRLRTGKGSAAEHQRYILCERAAEEVRTHFRGSRLADLGLVDEGALLAAWEVQCGRERHGGASQDPYTLSFALLAERWLRSSPAAAGSLRFESLETWEKEC